MFPNMRDFFAVLLICSIILGLAGCTNEAGGGLSDSLTPAEYGYTKTQVSTAAEIWDICVYDSVEYTIARTEDGFALFTSDLEDTPLYEASSEDTYLLCVTAGKTGVYLVESQFVDTVEEFNILAFSPDGTFSGNILLGYPGEAVYGIETDMSGRIYVQYAQFISVLASDGEPLYELHPSGEYVDSLLRSGNGDVFVASISENTKTLQSFSDDGTAIAKEYELPPESLCSDGFGEYDLLVYLNSSIFGLVDEQTTELINCAESGISFFLLQELFAIDDKNFLCMDNGELYRLSQVPSSDIVPRETLTMGILGDNNLEWIVRLYNAKSEKYYIQIKDYLAEGASFSDGVDKLNLDIISGTAPDLINFAGFSYDQYAEKGLLEDIGALMDAETSADISDYWLLEALADDGPLYVVAPGFMLMTYCGLSACFPNSDGCSYSQINDLLTSNPGTSIVGSISPADFLSNCVSSSYDDLIDHKNGVCFFDSENFIQMLELAQSSAVTAQIYDAGITDMEMLATRKQLLLPVTLQSIKSMTKLKSNAGQPLAFVGWPTPDGSNGTMAYLMDPVAINSRSKNKSGAWDFIRYILNDTEVQAAVSADCFPISKSAVSGELYDHTAYQKFVDLTENVDLVYQYDSTITDIVTEESAAYFAGDKTAEAVADIIQNRVQTYLNEQG